jgi:uncharacterized membrane protein
VGTKIFVLKLKNIIQTLAYICAAFILIIILIFLFKPKKKQVNHENCFFEKNICCSYMSTEYIKPSTCFNKSVSIRF